MYKILVSDQMSEEGLAPLLDNEQIEVVQKRVDEAESLESFDALLVRSATKVTEELLERMTNLKIVARAGVGIDNIDVESATKRGIIVINAPDGNTISTTEHTFAMIASLARNIPQATASVKAGEWKRSAFMGTELYGKSLGIVGLGRIGSELAKRALAFGMTVYVYDPYLTKERAEQLGVLPSTLDDLLTHSDIITVHTPLTKDTKGIIGYQNLEKTKKGVFLINCARGSIIDEEALYTYLESGHVAGVALDVFEMEPPAGNRLLEFDQVIVTPHIGASTKEAQLQVATQVSKEVINYFNGIPVSTSVNLPSISKDVFQKVQPFYDLSKKIGLLLSQIVKEPVREIQLSYSGEIADLDTTVTTRSLIAGFLKPRVDSTVNDVNAVMVAKERGISYGEKKSAEALGYSSLIEVTVHGETKSFSVRGTYIKELGSRIINLNGFDIDFSPEGNLLYIRHNDRPGVIGKVGIILGDHEVNIATMQVGRKKAGGDAIMMLSFDHPLDSFIAEKIASIKDIIAVRYIEL